MENKIKKLGKKGYTLIEVIVGVSIFMIILAASTDFFVSSLEMQKKALISQRLLDNISYSIEYMSRSMRMAQKGDPLNFEHTTTGQGGIRFKNYQGVFQEFYLSLPDPNANNASRLMVVFGDDYSKEESLTASFVDIVSFDIFDYGWAKGGEEQPRVTIMLEAKGIKGNKPEFQQSFKVQTTISQRNLDQ
jgi:prepilin-type N-terminal cleavage/methylation domain-containing protein